MKKLIIVSFLATVLFSSCASGHFELKNTLNKGIAEREFLGKTIGVEPFLLSFSANRFALDLRGMSLKLNGQSITLPKKYITEVDEPQMGRIGVMELNPLKTSGANYGEITDSIHSEWIKALKGESYYYVPFFNGFGEDNMGFISNRPLEKDDSVYPTRYNYLESQNEVSYFSAVKDLKTEERKNLDFILRGSIDISSEIVEVLEEIDSGNSMQVTSYGESKPQKGEYYLLCTGHINWEIINRKTKRVVVNSKSDSGYFMDKSGFTQLLLPLEKGDTKAFEEFFRTTDLTPYAIQEITSLMPQYYHLFSPMYKVTTHFIRDEE